MKILSITILVSLTFGLTLTKSAAEDADGKLRIVVFGAHPDDAQYKAGGVAAKWAKLGHHVKLVSVTNGDIGHWQSAGGPLAKRRLEEVKKVDEILGVATEVLDIHDGELMPTLENRKKVIRLIREWNADIVMSHRPNDYHPDHRYTGVLVQDAAFMVAVPFIVPDEEPLDKNPIFLYYSDRFQTPNPFQADIVVDIDPVIDQTVDALFHMHSQHIEGGALGSESENTWDSESERQAMNKKEREDLYRRYQRVADQYRSELIDRYGKAEGGKVKHALAFEVCEYGRQPSKEELRRLFP
ncbi:MAG: PIG-L family deacetylase [Verrucomicrobiales bacterium]|nr:PIG-L family deacetylase [Verrucomicrobiales bacterium]